MLVLLILAVVCAVGHSKIHSAYVLPHGGIALNPSHFKGTSKYAKQWAWEIHSAAVQVGKMIQQAQPDLILLSTPHGVADLARFMFYLNGRANGSAETDNCQCPPCCYTLDVKLDYKESVALATHLSGTQGMNVSGMTFYGDVGQAMETAGLKWGEVIPLLFIKDLRRTKLMILSQPTRRYDDSVAMVDELLVLGRSLYAYLDSLPQNIVVLISADLAHTHDATGPYGYSPAAEKFDRAIGNWASTLHPKYLLEDATRYVQDAKSCGFTGLVMLHGLLDSARLSAWTPVNHVNHHPSYYGMMVASFTRV